ncbi:MAG: hypothetical protein BWY57_02390 [Betaproteobacteria bacterium ADurb.Bin341]|nr:MAG: hypothetical protein BWY57_02390 [Betaproteobacteria bacterium ADurb.Bin341]
MLEDRGRFCDFFLNSVPNLDPAKRDVAMVAGACLWIRRDLWFELGGFPTWFGSTAEDLFLCCAARLRGMRVQVVDGPGFFHLIGHSLGGSAVGDRVLVTSKSRRFRSERNKIAVMVACYPAACLLLALPLLVASLLFEGLALSLMQNDSSIFSDIYWRALVCAWAERKRMLEMRRKRSVAMRSFFSVFVWIPYKLRMLWRYGIPQIK